MVEQQFGPRSTISSKLLNFLGCRPAWLGGWPVVWCYTTLLQQWCQPGWKAKCGHSAPTVTPGSCRIFFAHFFTCFRPLLPPVVGPDSLGCWWYVGGGDGVQGDPDEEGGEAEHKAGRNIPGFENVIPCEVDDLISEKRRSGRKLGWNNHKR